MDLMLIPELRDFVFELLGPELRPEEREDFDAEWDRMRRTVLRLGLEVRECEEEGLSYAEGARRPGTWALLARAHFGIFDILHDEVPGELLVHVRAMLERARILDAQGFGQDLLLAAAHDPSPASALVRFGIYSLIRLNLWLLTWDQPRTEAVGAMAELDVRAEQILRLRLGEPSSYEEESRPLVVLVGEALLTLVRVAQSREEDIRAAGLATRQLYDGLADAAELARRLGAADAHVLRNDYAKHVGGERLESLLLAERHPRVLPSAQAVDTRRSRLRSSVLGGAVREPHGRMVDLIREVYLGVGGGT